MTPEQFVYWLQGYVDINAQSGDEVGITRAQWQVVKDNLKEVFHPRIQELSANPPPIELYERRNNPTNCN